MPASCSDDSDSDLSVVHAPSLGKQLSSVRFVHVRHGISTPDSVLMSKPPHSDNVGHGQGTSTPSSAKCAWCTEHTGPGTAMGAALECKSSVFKYFRLAQDAGMLPVNALPCRYLECTQQRVRWPPHACDATLLFYTILWRMRCGAQSATANARPETAASSAWTKGVEEDADTLCAGAAACGRLLRTPTRDLRRNVHLRGEKHEPKGTRQCARQLVLAGVPWWCAPRSTCGARHRWRSMK